MLAPISRALMTAVFVLVGWLMIRIGLGALLVGTYQIAAGDPRAALLALPAAGGLTLGVLAARSAADLMRA